MELSANAQKKYLFPLALETRSPCSRSTKASVLCGFSSNQLLAVSYVCRGYLEPPPYITSTKSCGISGLLLHHLTITSPLKALVASTDHIGG